MRLVRRVIELAIPLEKQIMGKINLANTEHEQVLSAARSRTVRAADVRCAKLILMLEDGESANHATASCARWVGTRAVQT